MSDKHEGFEYQTPKKRLTADDLTPLLLQAKSFHLICSPLRCVQLIDEIRNKRRALNPPSTDAVFIWEPVPDLCIPEEQENCMRALRHVDVVSPNHSELVSFFGRTAFRANGELDRGMIEDYADRFATSGVKAVVVRAGKDGCYVRTSKRDDGLEDTTHEWLPAYHTATSGRVVDPTGGGNAFLGGLAVGIVRLGQSKINHSVVKAAALWATVSASFAIEQVGMPTLTRNGRDELWNGETCSARLDELERMI